MAIFTISTGLRNVLADAGADLYDGGALEIRTGSPPGPNAADTGTLLEAIALPTPAFGAASGGQASKAGSWIGDGADAAGTAGHFRLKQSGDGGGADATQKRIEGDITVTGGGGALTVDNTSIALAQIIEITGFNLTQPES